MAATLSADRQEGYRKRLVSRTIWTLTRTPTTWGQIQRALCRIFETQQLRQIRPRLRESGRTSNTAHNHKWIGISLARGAFALESLSSQELDLRRGEARHVLCKRWWRFRQQLHGICNDLAATDKQGTKTACSVATHPVSPSLNLLASVDDILLKAKRHCRLGGVVDNHVLRSWERRVAAIRHVNGSASSLRHLFMPCRTARDHRARTFCTGHACTDIHHDQLQCVKFPSVKLPSGLPIEYM